MSFKQHKSYASGEISDSMQGALTVIAEDVTKLLLSPADWMNFSNVSQAFREIAKQRISHFPTKSKPYFVYLGKLYFVDWLRPSSPIECIAPEVSEGVRIIGSIQRFKKKEDKVVSTYDSSNKMELFCSKLDLKDCHDIEFVHGDLYLKEDTEIKNKPDLPIAAVKTLLINALGTVEKDKQKIVARFESDYENYKTDFQTGISKATSEKPYAVVFGGLFWDYSKQDSPPVVWYPEEDESVKFVYRFAFNYGQKISSMNLSKFNNLVEIDRYAFFGLKQLTTLVVPNSLSVLGNSCFSGAHIRRLDLSKTQIKVIPECAFDISPLDQGLQLPSKLIKIANHAFFLSDLTEIVIPDSVEYIGDSAFSLSRLQKLTLSRKLTTIGEKAFENARLTEIVIPDSVKYIGDSAFEESRLRKLTLSHKLTTIGEKAFENAWLTEIDIPTSVKYIGKSAFYNSMLRQLDLSKTKIRVIDDQAFFQSPLEGLQLPPELKQIGFSAFYSADLSNLVVPATMKYIGTNAFRTIGNVIATRGIKLGYNAFGRTNNIHWIDPPETVGANQTDSVVNMEV